MVIADLRILILPLIDIQCNLYYDRRWWLAYDALEELREDINEKKTFSFGHCPNEGGGLPMPKFFGPFSRSAFLVNKKSLFLQKCQCIELLTVF